MHLRKNITLLFGRSYLLNTLSHQYVHEQLYSRNWSVIVFVPRLEKGDVALAKLRIFRVKMNL